MIWIIDLCACALRGSPIANRALTTRMKLLARCTQKLQEQKLNAIADEDRPRGANCALDLSIRKILKQKNFFF